MRLKKTAILFTFIFFSLISSLVISAQETETVVVDEVVAQINDGVLTLSGIRREMKDISDAMIQQGIPAEKAKSDVQAKEAEIIANLINEELLLQRGKEVGADKDADARVNQQLLQKMKELNLKNLDALYDEMRKANVNPEEYRQSLRKQYIRDAVLRGEVDGKIYWGLSAKEIKDYFEQNKTKFTKPETVTLSEIYLNFAGRDEQAVRAKARELVAQLRSGADFQKLAMENSDRPDVAQNRGKVGTFPLSELNEKISTAIKPVKVGGVAEPIEIEGGIEIIRVDERVVASSDATFNEDAVRSAITYEKMPNERKKFMSELRRDAYIRISESYVAKVRPVLYKDDTTAKN